MHALRGATILITGGTGSFGHKMAVELSKQGPKSIVIYSRDEKKQWEMQQRHPEFRFIIGDVRDKDRLRQVMPGVDFVFHAAALKQVPSCESHPFEAVKTNVIGSQNACEAAKEAGVKVFVALSTDKAVKPVNSMGISKGMMERIVCSQNLIPGPTVFCCVRYGNVMGSRGSVIPLFTRQIAEDVPLSVTVPHMTRFLMTLDDSVGLVLHALRNAQGGEVFVRKAVACTVADLADAMRRRYSPRGEAHPVEVVGTRPGEKIDEVLISEYEMQRVVEDDTFFTIHPDYRMPAKLSHKALGEEYTSANTLRLTNYEKIVELLERMGPTISYI